MAVAVGVEMEAQRVAEEREVCLGVVRDPASQNRVACESCRA